MGVNYYYRINMCPECGRYNEKHLGKSSKGWKFLFRGYSDEGIESFKDWIKRLEKGGFIYSEHGEQILIRDFIEFIKSKQNSREHEAEEFYGNLVWKDKKGYDFTDADFS